MRWTKSREGQHGLSCNNFDSQVIAFKEIDEEVYHEHFEAGEALHRIESLDKSARDNRLSL